MNNSLSMENIDFLTGTHTAFNILESAVSKEELLDLISHGSGLSEDVFASYVKIGIYKYFKYLPDDSDRKKIGSKAYHVGEIFNYAAYMQHREVVKEMFPMILLVYKFGTDHGKPLKNIITDSYAPKRVFDLWTDKVNLEENQEFLHLEERKEVIRNFKSNFFKFNVETITAFTKASSELQTYLSENLNTQEKNLGMMNDEEKQFYSDKKELRIIFIF